MAGVQETKNGKKLSERKRTEEVKAKMEEN